MSENCENKNPLQRDGTSQQQRLLKALLPTYVSVDERSINDLRELVSRYAQLFQFYKEDNTPDGDWSAFFISQVVDEIGQKTEPHYALFMSFIEILKFAQDDINTITKRHLDFYYKDVLRIKEKPAVPDQVFVIFELAQQIISALVAANTEVNGGPDKTGVDLIYKTEKEIVVNVAQATEFKSLFYNKAFDSRLYASPVANSANGLGEPIETEEPRWRTFGNIADLSAPFNSPLADRTQASVGFAFASPVLLMAEGNRNVKITLQFSNLQYSGLTTAELKNAFSVLFSGEKEWITPSTNPAKLPQDFTYLGAPITNTIVIQRTITVDQPPVIAYNKEILLDPFETQWPVMKILLNTQDTSNPYIYDKLKNLIVTNCTVTVDVNGVKELIVQNDESTLNASKPFLPFGGRPVVTSNFYVGSNEVFRKKLSSVDLNISWKGLPKDTAGFYGYYHNYIPVSENNKRFNTGFRTAISILDGHAWHELINPAEAGSILFNPTNPVQSFRKISIANSKLTSIPGDADMPVVEEWDNTTPKGFMRVQLANVDFGHSDYQLSYATQAINASTPGKGGLTSNPLPNEPYTPTMSSLTLDYVSSTSVNLVSNTSTNNKLAFENRVDQFFHVQPFGVNEIHPFIVKTSPSITLLPVFNDEGTLYIGITNLTPPQNLSVLFKVAEGSADPDLPKQNVNWSYLRDNEWIDFPKFNILSDSTNGLLTSGIVEFSIPKKIDNDNSLLTNGLYWIKATVANMSRAICDMITIQTQAVTAVFAINGNDPEHLRESLPAN
ncbi:MAG TPA: hypothetical protein VK177_01680, partial [Flavobacteriales bacterium]|nr:hypothetical protein [Flavobacteriales bacterium]